MIQVLQQYLLSKNISPVYIGFIPATSGVTIQDYSGSMIDPNHPYDKMSFQVRTKQLTYPLAQQQSNQAYQALQGFGLVFDIINMYAKQSPFYLKTDEQGYVHFAQNFEVEYLNRNRL